jgi:hypothetical protein
VYSRGRRQKIMVVSYARVACVALATLQRRLRMQKSATNETTLRAARIKVRAQHSGEGASLPCLTTPSGTRLHHKPRVQVSLLSFALLQAGVAPVRSELYCCYSLFLRLFPLSNDSSILSAPIFLLFRLRRRSHRSSPSLHHYSRAVFMLK